MNWLHDRYIKDNNQLAVYDKGVSLTYGELFETAQTLAGKLKSLQRKRMAVFIENSLEAVVLIHGMMQADVEMVLINTRLTPREIISQLNDIDVDMVVTTSHACPELQGIQVIHVDDLPKDNDTVNKVRQAENNEILSIMFTSGTTGKPKAVAQTYLNHHASALGCAERFHYDGSARWLFVNPIYHISGLSIIFRAVITGAAIYMVNKFDEDTVIRMIQDHHITHTSLVPVMLERLMKKEWTHELEGILLGGAGVDTALMKRAIDRHLPIHNSFGMTETCSQIVSISYDNDKILKSTVGRPPNNVEIKVDDNNELLVKADNVTPGYLNASIDIEDGYFRTGDLAEIDEAGYLYILDRRKDLIISGGENIYPKEIEDVVNRVAGVERSVVVKKKDSVWGEVPVLLVEGQATLSAIEQTLFTELAKYKQPKEIHFVETVYMTSTGKVSRAKNKEIYEVILGQ